MHILRNLLPCLTKELTRTKITDVVSTSTHLSISSISQENTLSTDNRNNYSIDNTWNAVHMDSTAPYNELKPLQLLKKTTDTSSSLINHTDKTWNAVHIDSIIPYNELKPLQLLKKTTDTSSSLANHTDKTWNAVHIDSIIPYNELKPLQLLKKTTDTSSSLTNQTIDNTWNAIHMASE